MRYSKTNCHIQVSYFISSHTREGFEPWGFKYQISVYKPLWLEKEVQTAQLFGALPRSGITCNRSSTGKRVFLAEKTQSTTYIMQPKMWDSVGLTKGWSSCTTHLKTFQFYETTRLWNPSPNFDCYQFRVKLSNAGVISAHSWIVAGCASFFCVYIYIHIYVCMHYYTYTRYYVLYI